MTPIIAVFMSMISLLALVADRANLQEQTLSVQGEAIPLPSVDDGVSRNFLDVAKRTLPLKMTPARSINLRRMPRAATGPAPGLGRGLLPASVTLVSLDVGDGVQDQPDDDVLLKSLIIHALRKRDIRAEALDEPPKASTASSSGAVSTASTASSRGAKSTASTSSSRGAKSTASTASSRGAKSTASTVSSRGARSTAASAASSRNAKSMASTGPATRPALRRPPRPNGLGDLKEDIMVHGRDREQLRRRWKIQNAAHRMANVHG